MRIDDVNDSWIEDCSDCSDCSALIRREKNASSDVRGMTSWRDARGSDGEGSTVSRLLSQD